jgi:hypothetical protein
MVISGYFVNGYRWLLKNFFLAKAGDLIDLCVKHHQCLCKLGFNVCETFTWRR